MASGFIDLFGEGGSDPAEDFVVDVQGKTRRVGDLTPEELAVEQQRNPFVGVSQPDPSFTTQGTVPVMTGAAFTPEAAQAATAGGGLGDALRNLRAQAALFEDPISLQSPEALSLSNIAVQTAATPQTIALGGPSQFIGDQAALVGALQARAAGRGPSVAEETLRAERENQLRQQLALAASQSGRAMPAVQRQLLQQSALSGQQLAQQAAIARAQEQQQAQQALGQALQAFRGQDIQRTELGLTASTANQEAQLRTALANLQAAQDAEALRAQRELAAQQFERQQAQERELSQAQLELQRKDALASLAKTEFEEEKAGERLRSDLGTKRQLAREAGRVSEKDLLSGGLEGAFSVLAAGAARK